MDNSNFFPTTTNINPNSPFSPFLEDGSLSSRLDNLKLYSTINDSIYAQFQIPRNTLLNDPGIRFPCSSNDLFIPENNVFDMSHTGVFSGVNPGSAIQELQNPDAVLDSFVRTAMHEKGSREIQECLKIRKSEYKNPIFEKLMEESPLGLPYILHLMVDQYGCFVFRKLTEVCNLRQLATSVTHLTSDNFLFIDICLTKYGSCSVMKLIRVLKKSHLVSYLVYNLALEFRRMMKEKFGLYVLSECLDQLGDSENDLLYRSAVMNCHDLATHKHGCISLNIFIEKIRAPQRRILMHKLCDATVFLAFDPSGNYVMQKILSVENPEFTNRITMELKGRYASLSMQKAGSHLVEKCLNSTGMITVVEDLINSNQVLRLAEDKYGNYVIQTAYKVTKAIRKLHEALVRCLYPYLPKLKTGYGKNVYKLIAPDIPQGKPGQPWLNTAV